MKFASAVFVAALLMSGAALAQTYSTGQRVEATNPATGKSESATITRIDGDRYLLHSDNAAIADWDVAVTDLRSSGSASLSSSSSAPASSGSLGSLPASGAPVPLLPPDNAPVPGDNAPPAEPR